MGDLHLRLEWSIFRSESLWNPRLWTMSDVQWSNSRRNIRNSCRIPFPSPSVARDSSSIDNDVLGLIRGTIDAIGEKSERKDRAVVRQGHFQFQTTFEWTIDNYRSDQPISIRFGIDYSTRMQRNRQGRFDLRSDHASDHTDHWMGLLNCPYRRRERLFDWANDMCNRLLLLSVT